MIFLARVPKKVYWFLAIQGDDDSYLYKIHRAEVKANVPF